MAAVVLAAGLGVLALVDPPEETVGTVRLVACAGMVWSAVRAYEAGFLAIAWSLAVLAVLSNPLVPLFALKEML